LKHFFCHTILSIIKQVKIKQEAQLSQTDRATLCVTEYFAESLKVIRNDTVEYGVCKSLLVFHRDYVPFMRHSASKNGMTLKVGVGVVQGH